PSATASRAATSRPVAIEVPTIACPPVSDWMVRNRSPACARSAADCTLQRRLVDLARGIAGELVDAVDILGDLVPRETATTHRLDRGGIPVRVSLPNDAGCHGLAPVRVRDAEDGD